MGTSLGSNTRTGPTACAVGSTTTLYRYDGQMGFADQEITGTSSVVTHYGLGARGLDFIERVGTSTVTVFPLYDGHGNMVATLSRNGTSYSLNDQRSYGAWGEIRTGASTGDPKGRYVANLGHKQDDESGLIYMRARYYEPSRGRFINQDPALDGANWFVYCGNDPVSYGDPTGKAKISIGGIYWIEWQNKDGDLAWGEFRGGQAIQRGQYVGNGGGALKHPTKEEFFNETVKKLLRNAKDPKVIRTLAKAGNIGLYASVLTTSLDAAFLSDPAAFSDLIDYVGGEWDLLGGFIQVSD